MPHDQSKSVQEVQYNNMKQGQVYHFRCPKWYKEISHARDSVGKASEGQGRGGSSKQEELSVQSCSADLTTVEREEEGRINR